MHGEGDELFVFHVAEKTGDNATDAAVGSDEDGLVLHVRIRENTLYERIYSGSYIQEGLASGIFFKAFSLFKAT